MEGLTLKQRAPSATSCRVRGTCQAPPGLTPLGWLLVSAPGEDGPRPWPPAAKLSFSFMGCGGASRVILSPAQEWTVHTLDGRGGLVSGRPEQGDGALAQATRLSWLHCLLHVSRSRAQRWDMKQDTVPSPKGLITKWWEQAPGVVQRGEHRVWGSVGGTEPGEGSGSLPGGAVS